MNFKLAELMLFNTCNFNCGYCGFVTNGTVKNHEDMAPFRDLAYIDKVFDFFEGHSTPTQKWILHLSGGEPLLMPNAGYFSRKFIGAGHKLGFNTNLSLPIDKNGWMDDNPPDGVDAIVASLHQEALHHLDVLVARVRALRKAGYPIAVRMVGHPLFMDRFGELNGRFRDIDVSFSVNPFYSPTYPAAYTPQQKETILQYAKTNYEAVRLNGGLDSTGRRCRAGSGLLCVALGISGGGNVYPCVNTATSQHSLGNIFDGNVRLFSDETECLRADKCCSCALHFIHNVNPSADDTEKHLAMLAGYTESIKDTYEAWLKERNIRAARHDSTPQGTKEGETILVLKKARVPDELPVAVAESIAHSIPTFNAWSWYSEDVASFEIPDRLLIRAPQTTFEVHGASPPIEVGPGNHVLTYQVQVESGGLSVGVQDEDGGWIVSNTHMMSKRTHLAFETNGAASRRVRVVIASGNRYGGGDTMASLAGLMLRSTGSVHPVHATYLHRIANAFRSLIVW